MVELSSFAAAGYDPQPSLAVDQCDAQPLDVHKDMQEYIAAKESIFRHQGPEDVVVLNLDNALTRQMVDKAPGKVLCFLE